MYKGVQGGNSKGFALSSKPYIYRDRKGIHYYSFRQRKDKFIDQAYDVDNAFDRVQHLNRHIDLN